MPRAGLDPAQVTEAAAALADEVGLERLSMGLVAERLGVKTPSLYKHVDGLADLTQRIAVLSMGEFADAIRDATQGRAGSDALFAAAQAMRTYITSHPGRYAAGSSARPTGPAGDFRPAADRVLASLSATLRGYELAPDEEIHALRSLRSTIHGFATIEAAGGFMIDVDVDESFAWLVRLLDQGLTSARRTEPDA